MLFAHLHDLKSLATFLDIHWDATETEAIRSQAFFYDGGGDEFILIHGQNHELILSEKLTRARFLFPTRFFERLRILSRFV